MKNLKPASAALMLLACLASALPQSGQTKADNQSKQRNARKWNPKLSKGALAAGIRAFAAVKRYEQHIDPARYTRKVTESYEEEADKAITEVKIAGETDADKVLHRALELLEEDFQTVALSASLRSIAGEAVKKSDEEEKAILKRSDCKEEIQVVLDKGLFSRKDAEQSSCGTLILD